MSTSNWPVTVEEAVTRLLITLDNHHKWLLKHTPKHEVALTYYMDLGLHVRNSFGLWEGNDSLLRACNTRHADDASSFIVEALWERLQSYDFPPEYKLADEFIRRSSDYASHCD